MLLGVAAGRWTDRVGSRRPTDVVCRARRSAATLLPAIVSGVARAVRDRGAGRHRDDGRTGRAAERGRRREQPEQRAENFSQMALGMSISTFAGPADRRTFDRSPRLSRRVRAARGAAAHQLRGCLALNAARCRRPRRTPKQHSDRNVFDLLGTRDLRRVYHRELPAGDGLGPAWLHRAGARHAARALGVADRRDPVACSPRRSSSSASRCAGSSGAFASGRS